MRVCNAGCAGEQVHKCHLLGLEFVQHLVAGAVLYVLPLAFAGLDGDALVVVRLELVQLHQDQAALFAKWRVVKAERIAEIGAGAEVTGLVGEDAVQHEDFLAARMIMAAEAGAGIVADDRRGMSALGFLACKRLAPHAGLRAGHPGLGFGVDDDP